MRYLLYVIIFLVAIGVGLVVFINFPKLKKSKTKPPTNASGSFGGDKAQLSTIFSNVEDGLILIDDKGQIVLLNSAAANMAGWSVDDAINLAVEGVIKLSDEHGNLFAGASYPFNLVASTGQTLKDATMELVTRDNSRIPVDITISPQKDAGDKVTGSVAIIRNITAKKDQETRLADFISTASHEMRTPVAAIEGYLSLALNNKVATVDDTARGYLVKAQTATKHLGTLFQDLLTSAKAEDGRLVSHPKIIEVGAMLQGLTEDLKFIAEKHDIETDFIVGSTAVNKTALPQVNERQVVPLYYTYADPDRIREVITNLYDNAVKYTDQGKITIGLTGNDQVVQFYVRDTGSGIPAEDIPHLFQKFYRVDNSATRTIGGNGLGLYICRKIVELYNGHIWVESEVGNGSTFYINLPRLSSMKAEEMTQNKEDLTTITPTTTLSTS